MTRNSPPRLQVQIALLGILLLTALIGALVGVTAYGQTRAETDALEGRAQALAHNLATASAALLVTRRYSEIEELLLRSAEFPEVLRIQVLDAGGRMLSDIARLRGEHPHLRFDTLTLAPPSASEPAIQYLGDRLGTWEPVTAGTRIGWVRIEYSLDGISAMRARILRDGTVIGLGFLVVGVLLLTAFLRRPVRAVEQATRFAGRLDELRGQTFAVEHCSREIEQLGEALNHVSRRLAEQEQTIAAATRRLEAILHHAIDGILTIDARGVIEDLNPAAARAFGYPADELVGRPLNQLVPDLLLGEEGQDADPPLVHRGEARMEFEVSGLRRDGTPFPLMIGLSRVEVENRVLYVVIVRDVTEQKKLDRMKNEFISSVSHELRTPLTSLHGSIELLAGGDVDTIDGKARELAGRAYRNSLRLVRLINDILDFENIEFGDAVFDVRVTELVPLLRHALDTHAEHARSRGVRLVLDAPSDPARVMVDDKLFSRAFAHLLSNATRLSPANGDVQVTVQRRDGMLRIAVTDHGPGVPDAERARIFEKFTQVDADDPRYKAGAGLGLNIARTITTRLGGSLGFDSVPGIATVFYIDLPEVADD